MSCSWLFLVPIPALPSSHHLSRDVLHPMWAWASRLGAWSHRRADREPWTNTAHLGQARGQPLTRAVSQREVLMRSKVLSPNTNQENSGGAKTGETANLLESFVLVSTLAERHTCHQEGSLHIKYGPNRLLARNSSGTKAIGLQAMWQSSAPGLPEMAALPPWRPFPGNSPALSARDSVEDSFLSV